MSIKLIIIESLFGLCNVFKKMKWDTRAREMCFRHKRRYKLGLYDGDGGFRRIICHHRKHIVDDTSNSKVYFFLQSLLL